MEHLFDVDIAKEYGVNAAIMIRHFQFWIIKNKANGRHFHDGKTWTYNTVQALADIFDYWTPKQVRTILEGLLRKKVLIQGNYNSNKYDRTKWYTFVDEERFARIDKSICPNGQMGKPKGANRFVQNGGPIPVTKPIPSTVRDTNSKEKVSAEEVLKLDLQIAEELKTFKKELTEIFHYFNAREVRTFTRVTKYLVGQCQAKILSVSIFKDAIKWAREAKNSNATNPKGLFVSKIKQATGFRKQSKLLVASIGDAIKEKQIEAIFREAKK